MPGYSRSGYQGGTVDWASPLTPDGVDRQSGEQLLFQSTFVREGHSGGGLFSDDWRLVGMMLEVAQAPIVRALPVNAILERLRRWNHAVGIVTGAPPARAVASPSAPVAPVAPVPLRERALVEDTTGDGRSVVSVTSWGRVDSGSAGQWATVQVSGATGLPAGAADLVLSPRHTGELQFAIKEDTQASRGPLQVDALGDIGVRVIKSRGLGGMFGSDRITETQRLTLRQMMAGQALRLRYTDDTAARLGGNGSRDVRLFLQAVPFEPESQSGPDQQLASAAALPGGALFEGSVAFNVGDATDHLVVRDRTAVQSCSGVMVVRWFGTVTVASSPAGDRDLASTPVAKIVAEHRYSPEPSRPSFPKQDVRLFDIACLPEAVIRVQASVADADGDYMAYLGRGVRDPKAFRALIERWLKPWEDSNLQVNAADVEAIVRGLASLRRSTAVTEAEAFAAYQAYLASGFAFGKPVFERVLKQGREALEVALSRCCQSAIALRALANVLRAEEGLPFDRRSVEGVNADLPGRRRLPGPSAARAGGNRPAIAEAARQPQRFTCPRHLKTGGVPRLRRARTWVIRSRSTP